MPLRLNINTSRPILHDLYTFYPFSHLSTSTEQYTNT